MFEKFLFKFCGIKRRLLAAFLAAKKRASVNTLALSTPQPSRGNAGLRNIRAVNYWRLAFFQNFFIAKFKPEKCSK
jgi:hypothetical protein